MVGLINPPSRGYIWILVATEYFTKWAEAVPLHKVTGGAVANFIKENIFSGLEYLIGLSVTMAHPLSTVM